ncbi:RNA polymerase sigma factor [Paenibacillus hodogayensis]|uniref:RNA polymerase sigma factor n=1 Tax=Paenibacillus hodogayensis TaxID=279208 RepID=A0ABV5W275_9BACL
MIAAERLNKAVVTEVAGMERLHAVLHRYCLSITGSTWDAEDLVQETWAKAFSARGSAAHANPEAWLLRIAKNIRIDQARRQSALNRIVQRERSPRAEQADTGRTELEEVFRALTTHMPALQATVFLLRDVLGYSAAEAAELLATTEGAVKAALHRARVSLEHVRKELNGELSPPSVADGMQRLVRSLAAAYAKGDAAALIALFRRGAEESALATVLVAPRLLRQPGSANRTSGGTAVRMAA